MTPNQVKFIFMCAQENVQIADAVGMMVAVNNVKLKKRDPLIMDDLLESYLELGREITEDEVLPKNETRLIKILKQRQDIIQGLRALNVSCYTGDCYETVKHDKRALLNYLQRLKRCIFYGFLNQSFWLNA